MANINILYYKTLFSNLMRPFKQIGSTIARTSFSKSGSMRFLSTVSGNSKNFQKLKGNHARAEQLVKKHGDLKHLQSFNNLRLLSAVSLPSDDALTHLEFLEERTKLFNPHDVNCFNNLDGVGDFNKDSIKEIVNMMIELNAFCSDNNVSLNVAKDDVGIKEIVLDNSQICTKVFQEYLKSSSCAETVLKLINEEKQKHLLARDALDMKLSKRTEELLHDLSINKLVSSCDSKSMEIYFPLNNFELLHNRKKAKFLTKVKNAVDQLKSEFLLGSYRKSNNTNGLLNAVTEHLLKSDETKTKVINNPEIYKAQVHGALCELSEIHNNTWDDYVRIVLARMGFYPNGSSFGEGLRLKVERMCIDFLDDESQLENEVYRGTALVKCAENGWPELAKLIKKKYQQ